MKNKNRYWILAFILGILLYLNWDPSFWSKNGYKVSSDPGRPGELSLTNSNYVVLVEFVSKIGGNKDFIIVESKNERKTEYWILKQKSESNEKEGPLNLAEFEKRKIELSINELKFEEDFKK